MRSTAFFKILILNALLFIETSVLIYYMAVYVSARSYFILDYKFSAIVILIMTILLLTQALTIGSWNKYSHTIISTAVISASVFIGLVTLSATYAVIAGIISFLFIALDTYRSYRMKNLLLKFDPRLIITFSLKGTIFVLALGSSLMLLINNNSLKPLNIGKEVSKMAESTVQTAVESQVKDQLNSLTYNGYSTQDPRVKTVLKELGIEVANPDQILKNYDATLTKTIENQVNGFLEPYKQLVLPLIALMVFGLFNLYGTIALYLFSALADGVFWLAKKTGFLKVAIRTVEKEELIF